MNAQFKAKLQSAGIDFTRFLTGVVAALASVRNPQYASIIEDGAKVLDAHLSTFQNVDDVPATATAIATAEIDGGFPGSPAPGKPAGAVNGHHDDTTAPENKPDFVAPPAPPAQVAPPTLEQRVTGLEGNISQILSLLKASVPPSPGAGI